MVMWHVIVERNQVDMIFFMFILKLYLTMIARVAKGITKGVRMSWNFST